MIASMSKIMPMLIVSLGVYKGAGKFAPLLQLTETTVVQHEVNEIAQFVYLDSIDEQVPDPQNFAAYVRDKMKVRSGSRDTSVDLWGMPYQLIRDEMNLNVVSNGPDRVLGTADDIVARVNL